MVSCCCTGIGVLPYLLSTQHHSFVSPILSSLCKHRHKDYGKNHVPLKWSNNLKASSQIWLRKLLDVCSYELGHDPSNKKWGENLASNYGTGDWAAVKS